MTIRICNNDGTPTNLILDDEENMSKDEVIAMLTELQLEIEENVLADDPNTLLLFLQARESCVAIIQQKINELKAEQEET